MSVNILAAIGVAVGVVYVIIMGALIMRNDD